MSLPDLLAMSGIALGVGLVLALEHLALRGHPLSQQWRYVMGVVTLLAGVVSWAAYCRLPWPLIFGFLIVLLAPGIPTFLLFYERDRAILQRALDMAESRVRYRRALEHLLKNENPTARRQLKRLLQIVDDMRFAVGVMEYHRQQGMDDANLFVSQIREILDAIEPEEK